MRPNAAPVLLQRSNGRLTACDEERTRGSKTPFPELYRNPRCSVGSAICQMVAPSSGGWAMSDMSPMATLALESNAGAKTKAGK
jgi:hypothetical protein